MQPQPILKGKRQSTWEEFVWHHWTLVLLPTISWRHCLITLLSLVTIAWCLLRSNPCRSDHSEWTIVYSPYWEWQCVLLVPQLTNSITYSLHWWPSRDRYFRPHDTSCRVSPTCTHALLFTLTILAILIRYITAVAVDRRAWDHVCQSYHTCGASI